MQMQAAKAEAATLQGMFNQIVVPMAAEAHLPHQTFRQQGLQQFRAGTLENPCQLLRGVQTMHSQIVHGGDPQALEAGLHRLPTLLDGAPWQQLGC